MVKKSPPVRSASRKALRRSTSPEKWASSRISIWSKSTGISLRPSRGMNPVRTRASPLGSCCRGGLLIDIRDVRARRVMMSACTV